MCCVRIIVSAAILLFIVNVWHHWHCIIVFFSTETFQRCVIQLITGLKVYLVYARRTKGKNPLFSSVKSRFSGLTRFKKEAVNPIEVSGKVQWVNNVRFISKETQRNKNFSFFNYNYVYSTIHKDKSHETSKKELVMHERIETCNPQCLPPPPSCNGLLYYVQRFSFIFQVHRHSYTAKYTLFEIETQ